jgi:hypothetical protein
MSKNCFVVRDVLTSLQIYSGEKLLQIAFRTVATGQSCRERLPGVMVGLPSAAIVRHYQP